MFCALRGSILEVDTASIKEADLRMGSQDGHLLIQFLRQPQIVGIEEGDELPTTLRDPKVPGAANPSILQIGMGQASDPVWMRLLKAARDRWAVIG